MAKKDYSETPPPHFGEIFVKSCFNCAFYAWTPRHGAVCKNHNFRFYNVVSSPIKAICGSWEINDKLIGLWKKQ